MVLQWALVTLQVLDSCLLRRRTRRMGVSWGHPRPRQRGQRPLCTPLLNSYRLFTARKGAYIRRRMFVTIKRLLIIIGVLFVILVGVSIYTFAILLGQTQANQASATPQTSLTSARLTPAVTMTTTTTAKGRKFVGTIQSLGNQTFVITLSRGSKTVTVNVDASTKFATSNGAANFNDLKVGQTVQVKGHVDPQDPTTVLAVSILVM